MLRAVLASCAVPGVLEPIAWGDRALMDGGVANNMPIDSDRAGELIGRALDDARRFLASGWENAGASGLPIDGHPAAADVRLGLQTSLTRQ